MNACVCFVGDDAYEILFTSTTLEAIVKYRHGLNVRGETVDYDSLPHYVQVALYNKLKRELARQRAEQNHDPRDD